MAKPPVLHLASRCCSECLMGPKRVVSGERAAEIVAEVRARDVHFQCHKGSIAGMNLHCRGVHDRWPSRSARFAQQFGIEIVEVDPDALQPRRIR
jgi:hypothetical protein